MITVKFKRFMPITWADIKPGYIIKVRSGQEFPADSLILDIQGANGSTAQKCYVTSGPFDDATGIIQKRSYVGTSNKTGSKQNAAHFAEMISGLLKFEYNYFGYIMGSFKLNENPASIEFDHENVVPRGALLTHSPEVICLVLNHGLCLQGPEELAGLTDQPEIEELREDPAFLRQSLQAEHPPDLDWPLHCLHEHHRPRCLPL